MTKSWLRKIVKTVTRLVANYLQPRLQPARFVRADREKPAFDMPLDVYRNPTRIRKGSALASFDSIPRFIPSLLKETCALILADRERERRGSNFREGAQIFDRSGARFAFSSAFFTLGLFLRSRTFVRLFIAAPTDSTRSLSSSPPPSPRSFYFPRAAPSGPPLLFFVRRRRMEASFFFPLVGHYSG